MGQKNRPAYFRIKRLLLEDRRAFALEAVRAEDRREERPAVGPAAAPDPRIAQLVAQVSKSNLTADIQALQNFQTRYTSTAGCESAGTYLYNYFVQLGLPCEYDPFSFSSNRYSSRNIVATIPGRTTPAQEVVVCAHYDSYSNQSSSLAPGADDNASGTAAVMEIARVLAGTAFDFTVKLICFSAEEWGLYGSRHYAQTAKSQGEKILGVINLDMIAFSDTAPRSRRKAMASNSRCPPCGSACNTPSTRAASAFSRGPVEAITSTKRRGPRAD
jgi:hypothetical protein